MQREAQHQYHLHYGYYWYYSEIAGGSATSAAALAQAHCYCTVYYYHYYCIVLRRGLHYRAWQYHGTPVAPIAVTRCFGLLTVHCDSHLHAVKGLYFVLHLQSALLLCCVRYRLSPRSAGALQISGSLWKLHSSRQYEHCGCRRGCCFCGVYVLQKGGMEQYTCGPVGCAVALRLHEQMHRVYRQDLLVL